MIGFQIVNLLVPGDPTHFTIQCPSGQWTFHASTPLSAARQTIATGPCLETYVAMNQVSLANGAACDAGLVELTPILLGASYLTGLSVTVKGSIPNSDCMIVKPSQHWPRDRAMGPGSPVVGNVIDFSNALENIVWHWPTISVKEKSRLLFHHWIDGLACWSLEDLYLSATTLLQVIADTEKSRLKATGAQRKKRRYTLYKMLATTSQAKGIQMPSRDWVAMRNTLIHEGRLLGGNYTGTTRQDCTNTAEEVLRWIDEYIHTTFSLGIVRAVRFHQGSLANLNTYSLP